MSSTSARVSKIEKIVRTGARENFIKSVDADFDASLQRAASNDSAVKLLREARADIIRKGQRAAEDAALEQFLAERAPEASPICYSQPQLVRLDVKGKRLADDSIADHIAVLVPHWTPTHDLLIDAREPTPVDRIGTGGEKAAEAAAKIELFGEPLRLLSDVEWQPIIDRTKRAPAVHPYFAKTSPTGRWYPTSLRLINTDGTPSGCVWAVLLDVGHVSCIDGGYDGFVRGGRLVPASEF